MSNTAQKNISIFLLAFLLIISTWLFTHSQVNHQLHQQRTENIVIAQQKINHLIQSILLAENGGLSNFDTIADEENGLTRFLTQLEMGNLSIVAFSNEINKILLTVSDIKSTYAIFKNSQLYLPKGTLLLINKLTTNGQSDFAKEISLLEREALLYSSSFADDKNKNIIIDRVNKLEIESDRLPENLSRPVKQLLKHATALVNHSYLLTFLNKRLLNNELHTHAKNLTVASSTTFQQEVNSASNVRRWFFFTIFLLTLIVALVLRQQQKILRNLNSNLELLHLANKAAQQGSFKFCFQTNTMQASEDYSALLGYKSSKFISSFDECLQKIHPNHQSHVLAQFEISKKTGRPFDVEYQQETQDGHWLWIHTVGEVIEWDCQQTPSKMTGIHANITERKQSEEALRALAETSSSKSESIFKKIVRQAAQSQNMRYALISLINIQNKTEAKTLAVWANDDFIENFSYPLAGSPCEEVNSLGTCYYPDHIQELFPEDHMLTKMQAVSYLGVPLKNSEGDTIGIMCVLDDKPIKKSPQMPLLLESLSTRASIEIERQSSEKSLDIFARIFKDSHEGIAITTPEGIIVDANPAFCRITGYSLEDVVGQNPRILSSGKQGPQFYTEMWQALTKDGHWQGEIWNRKKSGQLCAELLTISALKDKNDETVNFVGIFSDITHSKEQQQKLEQMAHYDVLTKLPNRALFYDRFVQAVAHSKRTQTLLAICFLDLDDFKPVNDTYGHNVGDLLLIEVSERIKNNIRIEDTVSRQGGDEFTLLLSDFNQSHECEILLQRIIKALSQPYIIEDQHINISASIGTTIYPLDDSDIDTLIRHADQAMYHSKLAGKNRYHLFNATHDQQVSLKHKRLSEIEQALINNELCLYYQPKVNMRSGKIYGAEALIRWQHPEKGLIQPLDFLPAIEETSLEITIGEWVTSEALKQLHLWNKQGIELEISINIASYHLQSDDFITQLEQALLQQPSINPAHLQLEILESSALGDTQTINTIIKSCQDNLGVKVALDDFGTGYSSLTHLRNLPAEIIKIDKSFVFDILDDPDDYKIVDGIIGLADSFNRDVIAEGVETVEHGLMLLIMGCDSAQGYGIARPMPANELLTWIKNYTPNEEWLTYSNKKTSHKDNRIQLLQLSMQQWQNKFQTALLAPSDAQKNWPIMDHAKCFCNSWIKRERHEKLFSASWLTELELAHQQAHSLANTIINNHDSQTTNAPLNSLNSEFKNIYALLSTTKNSLEK